MKRTRITLYAIFFAVALQSCKKDGPRPSFRIAGLTQENYPNVDGSTSTQPLHMVIAAELLGGRYSWEQQLFLDDTWAVRPNLDDIPHAFFAERIKTSQTHNALVNLIDGKADLIFSARRMSDDEKAHAAEAGVEVIETPIALDAFIFIANPANPVKSLSIKQVQDIYTGTVTNWQEVGGKDAGITPYVRNRNSGSQELMESMVMKGLEMPDWRVEHLGSMMLAFTSIRSDPEGLCYTVYYYKEQIVRDRDLVKTVSINGISPTKQTIADGRYPLVAEVYACIRADLGRTTMARQLYDYLQTAEGKRLIALSGYVPMP